MLVLRNGGLGAALPAPAPPGGVQYPVGSTGDQYNTCLAAGGDEASCAAAVITAFPTQPGTSAGFNISGVDLSALSTSLATMLSTPVTIGQNSVPVWAIGTLLISLAWIVTSAASGATRVTKKVTGRARKIRKGFTS